MFKIALRVLVLTLLSYGFASASGEERKPAKGAYTHIYVVALDVSIWSSEKVISVGGLTLTPSVFMKARAESEFTLKFDGGYVVKLTGGRLFYGDTPMDVAASERNIYVTPKDYQPGVFIRTFDQ